MLFHGSELVVHPEYAALFSAHGVRTVDDAYRAWCPGPPDPRRRSRVVELTLPRPGGAARLFFKSYDYGGAWRLRTLLIPARVKREWRNLAGLASLGVRAPRGVAYGQTRRFGLLTRSFLVTEAVEKSIDLGEVARGTAAPFAWPDARERRALITGFARQIRRCHDQGWFLYSPFFKNLLLARGLGGYELYVIDVPFAHIWRTRLMPERSRMRDLACLMQGATRILTPGERMRFYRTYAGTGKLTPGDKELLRRVRAYQQRHYP